MDGIKFIPGRRITKTDEQLEKEEEERIERELYYNSLDQIVIRRSRCLLTRKERNMSSAEEEEDEIEV